MTCRYGYVTPSQEQINWVDKNTFRSNYDQIYSSSH